jgi:hypothetical protein
MWRGCMALVKNRHAVEGRPAFGLGRLKPVGSDFFPQNPRDKPRNCTPIVLLTTQ